MAQRSLASTGPRLSTGSPRTFSTRPSVPRPTGTEMPAPVSTAFIRLQRHRAHAAFAEMLLHLGDDVDRLIHFEAFAGDAHGVIDERQVALLELHVHHRPDHLHHVAHVGTLARFLLIPCLVLCHRKAPSPLRTPLTPRR